jgi:hypothetical protein
MKKKIIGIFILILLIIPSLSIITIGGKIEKKDNILERENNLIKPIFWKYDRQKNPNFKPEYESISTTTLLDLPSSFDLRDVDGINYVSTIKSQTGGTCWTHGAMAAIEGNLIMTGYWEKSGHSGDPNLAEYHLDWWNGFNSYNNDDLIPPTGDGLEVHYGGDYRVTSAYLSRGEGAIFSDNANDDSEKDAIWYYDIPLRRDSNYEIYYPRDIEWFTLGVGIENIETIKEKIITDGVMGTCLAYSGQFMGDGYTHYQPPTSNYEPNHAVAIIGWDDNKETEALFNGAWLIKNSWGSNWGNDGYFWISYYDKYCARHPEMGAITFRNVEPYYYDNIYYHDYHGWRDTLIDYSEAFNKFISTQDEILQSVSFFTAADDVNYEIIIYDTFENNILGNEISSQTGFIKYSGFHTKDLLEIIELKENDDFYVYLKLSEGGQPIDRTSEIPVLLGSTSLNTIVTSSANLEESYYKSSNGTWNDLFDYSFDDPLWDRTANFCIKALTVYEEPKNADLDCIDSISFEEINPGETITGSLIIENIGESFSRLYWDIVEYPDWGAWTFITNDKEYIRPEDGLINIDFTVVAPNEVNSEFAGNMTIVNKQNPNDIENVLITLKTPRNKMFYNNMFDRLILRFPILKLLI